MIFLKRPMKEREQNKTIWIMQRENILVSLFFTGLFFMLLAWRFDFYYDLNDDTAIRDILSGIYTGTPSAYCIQMLFPLSLLISACYRIVPSLPWFGLLLSLGQILFVFGIGFRLCRIVKNRVYKVLLWCLWIFILSASLLYQFVMIQYTVVSGMLMVTAVFYLALLEEKSALPKWDTIYLIICILLSFQMRTEMCLLLMPFFLLVLLIQWLRKENALTKNVVWQTCKMPLLCMILMLLLLVCNHFAYSGKDWKDFMLFFNERTELYDFIGVPEYQGNEAFYESLSVKEAEWELLKNYNYAIDDQWNTRTFEQLIQYRKEQAEESGSIETLRPIYCYAGIYATQNIKNALWSYKQHLLINQSGIWYDYILALYCLNILMLLTDRRGVRNKFLTAIELIFLFGGRSLIWTYLFLRERMPERIIVPLYLTEMAVLISILLLQRKKENDRKVILAGSIVCLIAFAYCQSSIKNVSDAYSQREQVNQEWNHIISYCSQHDTSYYVLDVYSTVAYSEKMYRNVDHSYRNFDLCGGWIAKSPLSVDKMAKYQIENLEEDLLQKDNLFFISKQAREIDWLRNYYASKGITVQVIIHDSIQPDFYVYQIEKGKS